MQKKVNPMKIEINVTQDHINRGLRRTSSHDPIALAASEVFKMPMYAGLYGIVCPDVIRYCESVKRVDSNIPYPKRLPGTVPSYVTTIPRIILQYDRTGIMKPFSFWVELTDEQVKLYKMESYENNL